jgi:hypothetical protein
MTIVTKVVIVGVIGIAGYFIVKNVLPKDPLALDDSYRVTIDRPPQPSDAMRITNNSDIALRLHMFNASDIAKAFARENWVVGKGESKTYPRGRYVFNVWKSQMFDAHIKWTDELWTDVVFTGDANNLGVQGGPKPPVTIANEVDEELKACVYNPNDGLQAVALQCWTFGQGRTIEWKDAPSRFVLRVFKPALLDDPIITESDVQDMSALTISKKKPWWKFW